MGQQVLWRKTRKFGACVSRVNTLPACKGTAGAGYGFVSADGSLPINSLSAFIGGMPGTGKTRCTALVSVMIAA